VGTVSRKRILTLLLLALAFITLAVVGTRVNRPASTQVIGCANPLQGCSFTHHGYPAKLQFMAPPTPMQPFKMVVRAPGAKHVSAEVQMVGMDMGINRYNLSPAVQGTFTAEITLPVCVSGRRDWNLYLAIDDNTYVLPFSS
jgi:hypothetical protein